MVSVSDTLAGVDNTGASLTGVTTKLFVAGPLAVSLFDEEKLRVRET